MAKPEPLSYRTVEKQEAEWIAKAREARKANLDGKILPTGLAFSGGGIRSATFNLGVLQGLARHKLLNRFDYLSTVSGGGYIGSWLMGWLYRSRKANQPGGLAGIAEQLSPESFRPTGGKPEEAVPIRFLREHSNYLTPRRGTFTADTWAVVSIYLRNLVLNLTILVATLSAVLLLPRAWLGLVRDVLAKDRPTFLWFHGWTLPIVLVLFAVAMISFNLRVVHRNRAIRQAGGSAPKPPFYARPGHIQWMVVLPIMLACCLLAAQIYFRGHLAAGVIAGLPLPGWQWVVEVGDWLAWGIAGAVAYAAVWVFGTMMWGLAATWERGSWRDPAVYRKALQSTLQYGKEAWDNRRESSKHLARLVLTALGGGMVAGVLLQFLQDAAVRFAQAVPVQKQALWLVTAAGMPLVLFAFKFAVTYHIGLMGKNFHTEVREWWGKLGAWLFIYVLVWIGAWCLVILGPFVPSWVNAIGGAAAASGWLGSTLWAVRKGRGDSPTGRWQGMLLQACPYVFVAGLLVLLSIVLHAGLSDGFRWGATLHLQDLLEQLDGSLNLKLAVTIPILAAVALLLSWRVDVNEFSMHHFYRNRLVRCYQGASSQALAGRSPHPLTGFDPADDFPLSELNFDLAGSGAMNTAGPYPLLNTTLNLTTGKKLAWQKRRAASFLFSPRHCGFVPWWPSRDEDTPHPSQGPAAGNPDRPEDRAGFRPTKEFGDGVQIGTAMAISGAAASPNMGYHSTPALAFLMTIFNVRLGWWMANPLHDRWESAGPGLGLMYLLAELFGMTNAERSYVYLSDGGHFENLGIYELVRRRCKFILACDAEQDSAMTFSGLGNAVEKCRADFGVDIDIDLERLRRPPEDAKKASDKDQCPRWSQRHWAVGPIRYGVENGKPDYGILLYVKASLTGDEPADLLRYSCENTDFPHQPTADQWFDETQFESYRRLGLHEVQAMRREIEEEIERAIAEPSKAGSSEFDRFDDRAEAAARVCAMLPPG